MKDHVEFGHLTNFVAFAVNRDQVIDLETWFKIHSTSLKTISTLNFFYDFCDTVLQYSTSSFLSFLAEKKSF